MRTWLLAILIGCGGGADKVVDSGGSTLPGTDSPPVDSGTPPTDLPCDQIDEDEDGSNACDDCDDGDPLIAPGADERCNGIDDDCSDGPHPEEVDADTDGVLDCAVCDSGGFWLGTRDLSGSDLTDALWTTLDDEHLCRDYGDATDFLFIELDNVSYEVECVYTGRFTDAFREKPDATDMNTEHSWPQSLGADRAPAKCDLNHLFITDADANNKRAAYPFGEVVGSVDWSEGGSQLGDDASGSTVFEPRDEQKGNTARAMMYFATRYEMDVESDQLAVYRQWHADDPPDQAEIDRSQAIAVEQGAGNPFVMCPELAGLVEL